MYIIRLFLVIIGLLISVALSSTHGQIFVVKNISNVTSYTGLVGSRGQILSDLNSNWRSFNSKMVFYTFANTCNLQVVLQNFYDLVGIETGSGNSLTYTASIEYPANTFNQLLFSGIPSTTLADLSLVTSDSLTLSSCIPAGTKAWIRIYGTATVAVPHVDSHCGGAGNDLFESSTGTTTDKTMGGVIPQTDNSLVAPLAIISTTQLPSLVIWGDSIAHGITGGMTYNTTCDIGSVAYGLGPSFSYMKFAANSTTVNTLVTGSNSSIRKTLLKYASHVIVQAGIIDTHTQTLTTMTNNLQTVVGWSTSAFNNAQSFQGTLTPQTNSANGWIAPDDQTLQWGAGPESVRTSFNTNCRDGLSFLTGCFEVANQVENGLNGGHWRVDLGRLTADGTHPNSLGEIQQAGGWTPSKIHYP